MTKFLKQFIFISLGIAILVVGGVFIFSASNKGNNPYIYLKMDEGTASTTYDSMRNINGTLQGDATWKNEDECVSGKCLYLDGTGDYISIPDFNLQ